MKIHNVETLRKGENLFLDRAVCESNILEEIKVIEIIKSLHETVHKDLNRDYRHKREKSQCSFITK